MTVATLSSELEVAAAELEAFLPGRIGRESEDPEGSLFVLTVDDTELGPGWEQAAGRLWIPVPIVYPDAPPYPYYLSGASRVVPASMAPPLHPVDWRGMQVIQVSLRHNAWNPNSDTLIGCVMQVQEYLRTS